MRKELLELSPIAYLCPLCGEWHDWGDAVSLDNVTELCSLICSHTNMPFYKIKFKKNYFEYGAKLECSYGYETFWGNIPIDDFIENDLDRTVTFDTKVITKKDCGGDFCEKCQCGHDVDGFHKFDCVCCNNEVTEEDGKRKVTITLGFMFEESKYDEIVKKANQK